MGWTMTMMSIVEGLHAPRSIHAIAWAASVQVPSWSIPILIHGWIASRRRCNHSSHMTLLRINDVRILVGMVRSKGKAFLCVCAADLVSLCFLFFLVFFCFVFCFKATCMHMTHRPFGWLPTAFLKYQNLWFIDSRAKINWRWTSKIWHYSPFQPLILIVSTLV